MNKEIDKTSYLLGFTDAREEYYKSYDQGTDLYFKKGIIEGLNLARLQLVGLRQSTGDKITHYEDGLLDAMDIIEKLITQYQEKK